MYRIWDKTVGIFVQIKSIDDLTFTATSVSGIDYDLSDNFLEYKLGKDHDKKEIWSGDIIRIYDHKRQITWKTEVNWGINKGSFIKMHDKKVKRFDDIYDKKRYLIKYVGNIYQNLNELTPFFLNYSNN